MAKSIKYKNPDTYHDAGNVYDSTQGKTQEEINATILNTITKIPYTKIPNATSGEIGWMRNGNLVWLEISGLCLTTQNSGYAIAVLDLSSVGLPESIYEASGFIIASGDYIGELFIPNNGTIEIRSHGTASLWGSIVYPTSE